jgi:hypothetical protein
MAELSISGRMLVKTLKAQFKKEFGLTLRVYKGNKFADDSATLASLSEKKVEDFKANSNMKVGNFEDNFLKATGLKVQVASPNDKELCNDASTLSDRKKLYQEEKYKHL